MINTMSQQQKQKTTNLQNLLYNDVTTNLRQAFRNTLQIKSVQKHL